MFIIRNAKIVINGVDELQEYKEVLEDNPIDVAIVVLDQMVEY